MSVCQTELEMKKEKKEDQWRGTAVEQNLIMTSPDLVRQG